MKRSFSFSARSESKYAVQIERFEADYLSPELQAYLSEQHIEISDITLERLEGADTTDVKILQQIASSIADVFFENDNLIFYYYCDDLNALPKLSEPHQGVRPQEYRSKLFSLLFDRYVQSHHVTGINNLLLKFGEGQFESFVHIIYRNEHAAVIQAIKDDLNEGYSK